MNQVKNRLSGIRTLKGIVPISIRSIVGNMFRWLRMSEVGEDVWHWKQSLDALRKGGSLEPDPGLVGDKQYNPAFPISNR